MTTINEAQLNNTWKVKDICQGICCELDNILSDKYAFLENENSMLEKDYISAKMLIDKITELGYFSKGQSVNLGQVTKLVNQILSIENSAVKSSARVWAREMTPIDKFNMDKFMLCVQPIESSLEDLEHNIHCAINQKSNFVTTHLISNTNIFLQNQNINQTTNKFGTLSYGLVFDVNESNYVAATDDSYYVLTKPEAEPCAIPAVETINGESLYMEGYGTKLKTPKQIIRKFTNSRFTQNANAVVLKGEGLTPSALFCYDYGVCKINEAKNMLMALSKKLNLPLIIINTKKYLKQNLKYASNSVARSCFNAYMDYIIADLEQTSGISVWEIVKKLVGLNTNLRYNFIYKFSVMLNSHLKENFDSTEEIGFFIEKALRKTVEKHNDLTRAREKANGAPLVFPNEEMFIPLPNDFS